MALLLDTNVLIGLLQERLGETLKAAIADPDAEVHASVASLWEIAIKARLGKLRRNTSFEHLPELLDGIGLRLLAIEASHILAGVEPEPATRDPFDRLLLAQCAVEGMQLVTLDRALAAHPLAWRSG